MLITSLSHFLDKEYKEHITFFPYLRNEWKHIHTQNTLRTLYLSQVSDSINIQLNPHTITARENRFYKNKCSVREMPGGQKKTPHGRKSGLGSRHMISSFPNERIEPKMTKQTIYIPRDCVTLSKSFVVYCTYLFLEAGCHQPAYVCQWYCR